MASCIYCRRPAGIGKDRHDDCENEANTAKAALDARAASGAVLSEAEHMDELVRRFRPVLLEAAVKAGTTGAWILIWFSVIVGVLAFLLHLATR